MDHVPLGRTGLRVSRLCLGAMTFGESKSFMKGATSSDDEARRVLDASFEAGIDFIDTANVYSEGRSEELLGGWLKGRRPQIVLATKCRFAMGMGTQAVGPNDKGLSRRHILSACEDSLRRLGTDWIDLYQVHMQDGQTPIEETLRALDDLVRQGKVRYAGCSNYTGYRLGEAEGAAARLGLHRYESIQLQWNLITRDAERELIPAARAFGLGVLVWSPLARGFLSGKYRRGQPPPEGSRLAAWKDRYASFDKERNWKVLEAVARVAERRGKGMAPVALAWLLAKPECSSIIIGARTVAQLKENLEAQALKLTPEEVRELDQASLPEWGYPYDFIGNSEPW
ncbi:MAG: aldo/keto reductase [Deltaproteobacteria bacterium]